MLLLYLFLCVSYHVYPIFIFYSIYLILFSILYPICHFLCISLHIYPHIIYVLFLCFNPCLLFMFQFVNISLWYFTTYISHFVFYFICISFYICPILYIFNFLYMIFYQYHPSLFFIYSTPNMSHFLYIQFFICLIL